MLLHGAVALLVTFLLSASVTKVSTQQPVQCFTAPSTNIGSGCERSDPSFTADNIQRCCVQSPSGQFYRQIFGDQSCQACIVFGWFDAPEVTIEERGDVTILDVGFIKGALFEEFVQLDRRGELRFRIVVTSGTAREGANSDFIVPSSSRSAVINNPTIPARIQTLIRIDRLALELPEDFTLSLIGTNSAAIAALNAAAPNTFAISTIRVVIEDREEAVLQFTDSYHTSIESEVVISPLVQLLTNIATDLTVAAIPVNYTFVNDSNSPLLDVIPDVPDYNPNRPINATSFPFEDRDLNSTPVLITFPAGKATVRRINIGIENDEINEVEQVFIIFLQVVDAVDPARVDLQSGRFATLGRILDDDPLIIGFELNSYTVSESLNGSGELIPIPAIKGNNQQSELTFILTFNTITGSGPNAANINQLDFNSDIIANLIQQRQFSPDQQSIPFRFELVNDLELEALEAFQVQLSLFESGLSVNLGGVLADGSALFASTQIFIVDDDATVTIGWEEVLTSVNERLEFFEICVRTLNVTPNVFPSGISITLAAITIRGSATDPGDYQRLSERNGDLFFTDITATNSRACIEVIINDDNLLEETEIFTVQVVPDSFNHPTGLPTNVFLEPDLTVVEITDSHFVLIGFDATEFTVMESAVLATVIVADGDIQGQVRVSLSTLVLPTDTATATIDFTPLTTELVFDQNNLTALVNIGIINDGVVEDPSETFTLNLVRNPLDSPDNRVIISPDTATVNILDNDLVTVQFTQAEYTVGEADGMLVLTVDKRGENITPLQVTITVNSMSATVGEDFTAPTQTLTLPPGGDQQLQTLTVLIIDDGVAEGIEGFNVELGVRRGDTQVVLGEISTTTVMIIDNDGIAIGFTQARHRESEGTGGVSVTVQILSGRLETSIAVRMYTVDGVAITPEDYHAIDMTLMFSSLTTTHTTEIEIVNDNSLETTEHFFVRLEIVLSEVPVSILRNPTRIIITSDDQCPGAGVPVSENPLLSTDPLAIYCVDVCYRKFRRGRLCPG